MAFEQKTWTNNGVATEEVPVPPAFSADNMNRIEQGIADAHKQIDENKTYAEKYTNENILFFYGKISVSEKAGYTQRFQLPDSVDFTKYNSAFVSIRILDDVKTYPFQFVEPDMDVILHKVSFNEVTCRIDTEAKTVSFSINYEGSYSSSFRLLLMPTATAVELTETV